MSLTRTTLHLYGVSSSGNAIFSREFPQGYPLDEVEKEAKRLSRRSGVTSVSVCRIVTNEQVVALYRRGKKQ